MGTMPSPCAHESSQWQYASASSSSSACCLKILGVASADGDVVRLLGNSRGTTLGSILNVVTTMGDSVPTLTLAAVLSVVLLRQGRLSGTRAGSLPLLVHAKLLVQFSMGKLFGDLTIADVAAGVALGNHGYLPSGSVARLSSIFLATALLWRQDRPHHRRNLVTLGAVLVIVQTVTRLIPSPSPWCSTLSDGLAHGSLPRRWSTSFEVRPEADDRPREQEAG